MMKRWFRLFGNTEWVMNPRMIIFDKRVIVIFFLFRKS
jgi:hypothetical protein